MQTQAASFHAADRRTAPTCGADLCCTASSARPCQPEPDNRSQIGELCPLVRPIYAVFSMRLFLWFRFLQLRPKDTGAFQETYTHLFVVSARTNKNHHHLSEGGLENSSTLVATFSVILMSAQYNVTGSIFWTFFALFFAQQAFFSPFFALQLLCKKMPKKKNAHTKCKKCTQKCKKCIMMMMM